MSPAAANAPSSSALNVDKTSAPAGDHPASSQTVDLVPYVEWCPFCLLTRVFLRGCSCALFFVFNSSLSYRLRSAGDVEANKRRREDAAAARKLLFRCIFGFAVRLNSLHCD
jgi:hypothetical protein